ncbi:MAG: hypothetical protein EOO28_18710 [Comamonadaceae bacterium]|nr:MAG: hypothetical protein EOO28_18710 [Comamonadaceae bacterium]
MARSSIMGGMPAEQIPDGRDNDLLGPSDTSDSGSDVQSLHLESDTDSSGTGERASVEPGVVSEATDILPDRVTGDDALDLANVPLAEADELAADEDDEDTDVA